jgi:hypothetical protein
MISPAIILGEADVEDMPMPSLFAPGSRDGWIIFGALALLILGILIWATFFRKQRRSRKHHAHHHSGQETPTAPVQNHRDKSRRKGRRRRTRLPLNPTLAQTGGLPPLRHEPTPPRN